MNEVYEQYKLEHPEELREVNRLKAYSGHVEAQRGKLRKKKLKKVEECRRILYGDSGK